MLRLRWDQTTSNEMNKGNKNNSEHPTRKKEKNNRTYLKEIKGNSYRSPIASDGWKFSDSNCFWTDARKCLVDFIASTNNILHSYNISFLSCHFHPLFAFVASSCHFASLFFATDFALYVLHSIGVLRLLNPKWKHFDRLRITIRGFLQFYVFHCIHSTEIHNANQYEHKRIPSRAAIIYFIIENYKRNRVEAANVEWRTGNTDFLLVLFYRVLSLSLVHALLHSLTFIRLFIIYFLCRCNSHGFLYSKWFFFSPNGVRSNKKRKTTRFNQHCLVMSNGFGNLFTHIKVILQMPLQNR